MGMPSKSRETRSERMEFKMSRDICKTSHLKMVIFNAILHESWINSTDVQFAFYSRYKDEQDKINEYQTLPLSEKNKVNWIDVITNKSKQSYPKFPFFV